VTLPIESKAKDASVLEETDVYPSFNYPSKKLYKRLLQLGANMLIERGDCDDQHYLG
jgi:sulfite reductase alpha subunit-like flavoprotein